MIDAQDLSGDPRFADARSRNAHAAELKAELTTRLAPLSAVELEPSLMQAGCPAALVRTSTNVLELPLLGARSALQETHAPGRTEPVSLINAGFVANADGPHLKRAVPALGEHTDEVLRELGYADGEIEALRAQGAV